MTVKELKDILILLPEELEVEVGSSDFTDRPVTDHEVHGRSTRYPDGLILLIAEENY